MAAKKTTQTRTPSTSGRRPKPGAANSAASTLVNAASPTPPTEPLALVTNSVTGDAEAWAQANLQMGAQACLLVLGAETSSLSLKLADGKRSQSLPPGDILVVVLPPGAGRTTGVYLTELASK